MTAVRGNRPRWPKSNPLRVARALGAHRALALAVGAIIYILAISGTLSVFNHEFQRWEQPGVPEYSALSPAAAERAVRDVLANEPAPTSHLYVQLPTTDLPRTVVTTDTQAVLVGPDGEIVAPESHPWTQFVLDLHYYLHLPHIAGLTVVGGVGVLLLALTLTGLFAHPRIFRDAFTLRRGRDRLTRADIHNRLAVWTIPFHVSNALTGAILGLATVLAYAVAAQNFGGDLGAVFDPVFGEEPAADPAPGPIPAVATPLAYMAENFPDIAVNYVILHDPGTVGQHTTLLGLHGDRLIFGEYYNFDASGAFQGTVGMADGTLAQQVAGSVYNVHFGNWGGLPVKLAYLAFGLALTIICATGFAIYFLRRRAQGRPAPRLEGAWRGVVWGTPAGLSAALVASLAGVPATLLPPLFWIGLVIAAIAGVLTVGRPSASRMAPKIAGGMILVAVLAHAITHGPAALSPLPLGISAALAFAALYLLIDRLPPRTTVRRAANPAPSS